MKKHTRIKKKAGNMMDTKVNILPLEQHISIIENSIEGYYANDVWSLVDCPVFIGFTRNRYLRFDTIKSNLLRNEMKFYFYKRIVNMELNFETVRRYVAAADQLFTFISKYPKKINTIIDIPRQKFLIEYRTFLIQNDKKPERLENHPYKAVKVKASTAYLKLYFQLYDFFKEFYDDREELDKDKWDVRKLKVDYNNTSANYFIEFKNIQEPFKSLVKKYIKFTTVIQQVTKWSTAISQVNFLRLFFKYIQEHHPNYSDLKELTRTDIINYIDYVRITYNLIGTSNGNSNNYVLSSIGTVEKFIWYMQRYDWPEAPRKSVSLLIFSEDKPKVEPPNANKVKYIPDYIWEQILNNIKRIPSQYVPILLVLEATGFRISDVLTLKFDCLEEKTDGWWIVGDQMKVKHKDHKVPIDFNIAKIVKAQQQYQKPLSTKNNNPNNYLFPVLSGRRKGMPVAKNTLTYYLNKIAFKCRLVNEKGEQFKINNHAFRHRYGVNLINNGMNIVHVQKLMAHASPEMTLVYAQIHDSTLRREWENARGNRSVKLNVDGEVIKTNIDEQAAENGIELEWIRHNLDSIRLDHGYCIKSPKLNCEYLEQTIDPPCIKNNCRSFHVDSTFFSYYQDQINKMESDIDIYRKTGRLRSIELIQPKLFRFKKIIEGLINGESIFGLEKSKREYIGSERV
jgi:integrase